MADSTIKILSIILFLVLISQGNSKCYLSDLSIRQSQTGAKLKGKPEWGVTITNNCPCVQKNVMLNCRGFQTIEHINPSVLSVSGNVCLVNGGNSIYRDAITFKYAWDQSFPLNPISSEIACS
ncbi:uncharacterized protein LOC133315398 [Gastrolobium bilobum]|uniref:uncharacterized protein LOC133315398 n=1 Tax=Gastrolobium bilobum TaxID=150636 RepID=UPI002AB20C93|nr:uncharacterized protein LOC133315398 [Gastrolobium bilobum]